MSGEWRPQIIGSYSERKAVLVVRISPPLAGAWDYYVCAVRQDDSNIYFEDAHIINVRDFCPSFCFCLLLFFPCVGTAHTHTHTRARACARTHTNAPMYTHAHTETGR